MGKRSSPLDHVSVAAPCSVGWDNMIGNETVRFCGQCNLNVYNLSGMTKQAAEHVVAQAEGRLCVRYYQRADGTIITKNCPVGLRAIRARLSRVATASASAVLSFFAGMFAVAGWRHRTLYKMETQGSLMITVSERLTEPAVVGTPLPRIVTGDFVNADEREPWIKGQLVAPERPVRAHRKRK